MKKAIVLGATSGIGRELVKVLFRNGYAVGAAGRREKLLESLREEVEVVVTKRIDLTKPEEAMTLLSEMISELGGLDLLVISSGTGHINPELNWNEEKETINVNVSGFTAAATVAFNHFRQAGGGHLAAISSVAAL